MSKVRNRLVSTLAMDQILCIAACSRPDDDKRDRRPARERRYIIQVCWLTDSLAS